MNSEMPNRGSITKFEASFRRHSTLAQWIAGQVGEPKVVHPRRILAAGPKGILDKGGVFDAHRSVPGTMLREAA